MPPARQSLPGFCLLLFVRVVSENRRRLARRTTLAGTLATCLTGATVGVLI